MKLYLFFSSIVILKLYLDRLGKIAEVEIYRKKIIHNMFNKF